MLHRRVVRWEGCLHRRVTRIRVDGRTSELLARPPVVTIDSGRPGPTAAITANVHGDECTGVLAAQELDRWLVQHLRRGTVHLYPSLNPAGLAARTRGVGADGGDLNRLFPGDAGGDVAERLAFAAWRDLREREPDVVLDLHADSAAAIPYAIVDRPIAIRGADRGRMEERLVACAEATGLTVLRDYPSEQYQRFGLDRSLAGAMVNKARVPAVTIESGPRRLLDLVAVRVAVDATVGVLAHLGLVDAAPAPHPSRVQGTWRRSTHLRVRQEGLFVPRIGPGASFRQGESIGELRAVTGEVLEEVVATEAGIVVSWLDTCWVAAGASIGTLGVAEGSN